MNRFYVTTPIYYVNDAPHIGHAYTTILADVLVRFHRLKGEETFFLTGTDEHGQKIQQSALARGITPQEHCDEYVERFKSIWRELNISNDFFIRTTDSFHKEVVSKTLQDLYNRGEIYQGEYQGWYSVSEEMFFSEDELIDGKSPLGKEVVKITEKNYFFKMSKYQNDIIQKVEGDLDFIQPAGKRSEVLGFLKKPMGDLCISRPKSRLEWGVELPFDKDYVTYVWFDALLNYLSALGYRQDSEEQMLKFWPVCHHLIGKDILMTHSIYWLAMLRALNLDFPKTIFAHGWWLTQDLKKMSKSEGEVVSPLEMKDVVGVDGLRYFLIRSMNPANDGQFSKDLVIERVNAELANNLGNLINRSTALVVKYFDAKVPLVKNYSPSSVSLKSLASKVVEEVDEMIDKIAPHKICELLLDLLTATNKYIDEFQPWTTAKSGDLDSAAESLSCALEVIRIVATLLNPVMPVKSVEILERIGLNQDAVDLSLCKEWGVLFGKEVKKGQAIFPRISE